MLLVYVECSCKSLQSVIAPAAVSGTAPGAYISVALPYNDYWPLDFIASVRVFKQSQCTNVNNQVNIVMECYVDTGAINVYYYDAEDTSCSSFPVRIGRAQHLGVTHLGHRYYCASDDSFLNGLIAGYTAYFYFSSYFDPLNNNVGDFQLRTIF